MPKKEDPKQPQLDASLWTRRDFLERLGAASGAAAISQVAGRAATTAGMNRERPVHDAGRLFPQGLPELAWTEFSASGFAAPVSGVIYHPSKPPCCGAPVGGISTGCLDINVDGVYGYSSIFNPVSPCPIGKGLRMPRKMPSYQPLLGLSIEGRTHVLTTQKILEGGEISACLDPFFGRGVVKEIKVPIPKLDGVEPAKEISYWGHYPVVDIEYETDTPVTVGLRAWAPFIPGDTAASNIPAAVFEVHLRNTSSERQHGAIAFNFPGPDPQEARATDFRRRGISEDFHGVMVSSEGGVNYVLGVIGKEKARLGAGLNGTGSAWSKIASELPEPSYREAGEGRLYTDPSSSAAVDFSLAPGESKAVRFLLAWYAPVWEGARKAWVEDYNQSNGKRNPASWNVSKWAGDTNYYTHMYAGRYWSALDVARRMAKEHAELLERVLAWQSVIYAEESLPAWLKDSLVNNLYLITEDSMWAQARPPLGDAVYPDGAYGLIESPRGDPDIACIPCDWYGNLPIVYFFPELARSTLKLYMHFQREDGAAPFWLGILGDTPDFVTPAYDWQISLNGTCYVDLVDRLWQRTGDDGVLREFYESVKKCNTLTMNLRKGPRGVISMPEGNQGMEWFERGEWVGMCSHLGGLHLAQLRMMERMATHMGDEPYARQCRAWLADGSRAMEDEMWAGKYYWNFYEPETGKKSDDVMGYQLDGQWAALFHGLPGVFRTDRVETTLETIKRCNVALTPKVGAANFCRPDGTPVTESAKVAAYGTYAMFTPEVVVLGMTYIYAGEKAFGVDLVRRHWEDLFLRQGLTWDTPNLVRGDTGERIFGTDYYQDMMLWALPMVMNGQDIKKACASGSLVDRVIKAGNRA